MIACVTREIVKPDGTLESSDTRYFITSLSSERIAPGQLLQTIRNHWQVENNLHWMKDRRGQTLFEVVGQGLYWLDESGVIGLEFDAW